jgi:hypothetical protein
VSRLADASITMAGLLVSPLVRGSLPDLWCHAERPSVSPWQYRVSVAYQSLDVPGLLGRAAFRSLRSDRGRLPDEPAQAGPHPTTGPMCIACDSVQPGDRQLGLFALLSSLDRVE